MSYVILAFGAQLSVYWYLVVPFCLVHLIFPVWLYHLVMSWLYAFGQIDISFLVASFGDVCPFGRIDYLIPCLANRDTYVWVISVYLRGSVEWWRDSCLDYLRVECGFDFCSTCSLGCCHVGVGLGLASIWPRSRYVSACHCGVVLLSIWTGTPRFCRCYC